MNSITEKMTSKINDFLQRMLSSRKLIFPVYEAACRFKKTALRNKAGLIDAISNGDVEKKKNCEKLYDEIVNECLKEIRENYKYMTEKKFYKLYCEFIKKIINIISVV